MLYLAVHFKKPYMRLVDHRTPSRVVLVGIAGIVLLVGACSLVTARHAPVTATPSDTLTLGFLKLTGTSRIVDSAVEVTVTAVNIDTSPVGFGLSTDCQYDIEIYQDVTHLGTPIRRKAGTYLNGRVDVPLAPGQARRESCGRIPINNLVQGQGSGTSPIAPGTYYVFLRIARAMYMDPQDPEPLLNVGEVTIP
ncbi:MAG TPA: hypothetical protein VNU46_10360 [Gemmatimonadaceae bacterium]|nr:hypothetical protein [Gemmatimonadaceae bacterium]